MWDSLSWWEAACVWATLVIGAGCGGRVEKVGGVASPMPGQVAPANAVHLVQLTDTPPQYVRLTLNADGVARFGTTTLVGEWIGSHVHDYWTMEPPISMVTNPKEVTQMLFDSTRASPAPTRDGSLRLISSRLIRAIEGIPPTGAVSYRDFLRQGRLCLGAGWLGGAENPVLWVDRENYDPRDHLGEEGEGQFAWDFVQRSGAGNVGQDCPPPGTFNGGSNANSSYAIWHRPLRLPIAGHFGPTGNEGVVVDAVDTFPDINPSCDVPRSLAGKENSVSVAVYGNFQVIVEHLAQGSIPPTLRDNGKAVAQGEEIGRVGNSGWSQYPHIHVALLWNDENGPTERAWSVPVEFCNVHLLSGSGARSEYHDYLTPKSDVWLSPTPVCAGGAPCSESF
jgi:hypothetical protein